MAVEKAAFSEMLPQERSAKSRVVPKPASAGRPGKGREVGTYVPYTAHCSFLVAAGSLSQMLPVGR